MIDLHSHVLPGIDDGAKDASMSIDMLKEAKRQGVTLVAATPHCVTNKSSGIEKILEKRSKAFDELTAALALHKNECPEVILGAEVYLGCDLSELPELSKLCYQNTNYILLECAHGYDASKIAEWVYNISIKGLKPIMAHIDRYSNYKDIMQELQGIDVIYQVNAARFCSMLGRMTLKNIFNNGDKVLVSSDMHNLTSRAPNMAAAYEIAGKKFGALRKMLFEDCAKSVTENKPFVFHN